MEMFSVSKYKYLIVFFVLLNLLFYSCTKTEKSYWENGKLKSVLQKKGRRYNGLSTWYYSDGIKQHQCNYVNDMLQGTSSRWYNNGRLCSIDNYKDNLRQGKSLGYDMDGNLNHEANYYLDTLDGPYKEYYSTGQAKVEGNYVMGRFDGRWIYYLQDGTVVGMGEYINGNGKLKAWYPDGKIKRIVQYRDNEKHGTETWYTHEGKTEKILLYDQGQLTDTENQSN